MKLRLRSLETKETLKIETPNSCNLQQLKDLISHKLPSTSNSSTIHLSLNQKKELITQFPDEPIQSIGITSGDLIYFTTNPNGFSTTPQLPLVTPSEPKSEHSQSHSQSENPQTLIPNSNNQDEKGKSVDFGNSSSEQIAESMEIDDDTSSVIEVGKSFSVPGFLRKVFTEEMGDNDNGLNHKLLCIAIHAILLESGFVEIDPNSNLIKNNKFNLQQNWYLTSFYYTLPNIIITHSNNIETVKIKFQNLGKYCKVYGSLVNPTRVNSVNSVHSVLLDEDKLVPFLNVVWANCGQVVATMGENNAISNIEPEKEVFEFWRKIKDGIALPLLIDLCEKSGLNLPACFMQLPTELKLKILESVTGVEIAKVSCVCSELRYLSSSDDLWKQKYVEEFGDNLSSESGKTFKERFVKEFEGRKRRNVGRSGLSIMRRRHPPYGPFGIGMGMGMGMGRPRIIGGEYDLGTYVGPRVALPRDDGARLRNGRLN